MKVLGAIVDWFRVHKFLGFIVGLIILGVVGIFLYTSIRTTSDRAITSGKNELENQTEDVDKEVKKDSKGLKFSIPMAEDVVDKINKQEELDGELDPEQKEDFVVDEFGTEVGMINESGYLPSRNLTKIQNKQQLDKIKQIYTDDYAETFGAWFLNTTNLVYGEGNVLSSPNTISLKEGYTLPNQSQFFNIGDYSIGGIHVNSTNLKDTFGLDDYSTRTNFQDLKDNYLSGGLEIPETLNILSESEELTVISFYIRPNEDTNLTKVSKDTLEMDFKVNGIDTTKVLENEQDNFGMSDLFGGVGDARVLNIENENAEMQSTSIFLVHQYIPTNVLNESNNKISISGNEYKLKKVKPNDSIDLTNTYSE